MKILEKIALVLFSIIVLIMSVVSCLLIFNVLDVKNMCEYIEGFLENDIFVKTTLIISAICILLAIKSLFFPSKIKKKEEIKSGVLLENQDGRLLISKDTIENLVNSVVRSFPDALDTQTKVFLDTENNITVFISLFVKEDAIIKQLSANVQNKIKEIVKRNTDLDVKQVNINIKNIENEKTKKENSLEKIKLENVIINNEQTNGAQLLNNNQNDVTEVK